MHQYLRSIGFSNCIRQQDVDRLLDMFEKQFFASARRYADKNDEMHVEIRATVDGNMGICIVGTMDDDGNFKRQAYYPYLISDMVSSMVPVQVLQRMDGNLYSGILDDTRVGVTMIFMLINPFDNLMRNENVSNPEKAATLFSALSVRGRVLLPSRCMLKNGTQEENMLPQITNNQRIPEIPQDIDDGENDENAGMDIIQAAREGNPAAMEQIAYAEVSTMVQLNRRLKSEDVYSVVETVFMPNGAECDLYLIIGEIRGDECVVNPFTGDEIYILTVDVNGIVIRVAINAADLEGAPDIGRRFKGVVWLQGSVE